MSSLRARPHPHAAPAADERLPEAARAGVGEADPPAKGRLVRLPLAGAPTSLPGSVETSSLTRVDRLLQVGDLAKATGKTVRAIHHYEELGLLRPDARSKGRFRLYDPAAVTRVRWIGKLHDLGLSLGRIQEVVSAWEAAPSAGRAMAEVRATYVERLAETRAQIARLRALEAELEASVDYLDTCETCDLDVLSSGRGAAHDAPDHGPSCGVCQHRETHEEPELVAGIHAGADPGERRDPASSPA